MTEIEKLREAISHLGGSGEQSEFAEGYDAAIRDVLRAIDMPAEGTKAPEAGAPDKWILPDGLDRDRVQKAVEVVVGWEEDGAEDAVDIVLRLYPVLCPQTLGQ